MATKKLQILDGLGFVSYKEQSLTEEQKAQVRTNIGTVDTSEIPENIVQTVNGIEPDESGNVELGDGYEWHTIPYSIFSWDVSNVPGNETITDWDGLKAVTIPGETTVAMGRLLFNIQNLFTQGPSSMNSGVLDKAKSIATAYLAIRDAGIFNNTVAFVVKSGTQKHHYELAYRSDKNVLTIFERFMDRNADAFGVNIDTDEITQEDIDHNFMWTMKYVDATKVPIPETASIGQVLSVKSVDENGKPTEWEAVDLPSGDGNALYYSDATNVSGIAVINVTKDPLADEWPSLSGTPHVGDLVISATGQLFKVSEVDGDTMYMGYIMDLKNDFSGSWNDLTDKPDEEDALALLAEMGFVEPVTAEDGSIYTDENGNVYTL